MPDNGRKNLENAQISCPSCALTTFALVIHTIESFIPVPIPVPGVKLGLANVITLLAFVLYGLKAALVIAVVRTTLGSIFAGNFLATGFYLSFGGALVSALAMAFGIYLWRRDKISLVAVSIMGAVAHNTTQATLAALILANFYLIPLYLPVLLVAALPTGFLTGLAVTYSHKALTRVIK